MRTLAATIAAGSFLVLAGCSKPDPGPSCAQVVDNLLAVTKAQLTGHGDLELGNRAAMLEQCERRNLTPDQRTCLAAAKDLTAIAACTPSARPPAKPRAPAAE